MLDPTRPKSEIIKPDPGSSGANNIFQILVFQFVKIIIEEHFANFPQKLIYNCNTNNIAEPDPSNRTFEPPGSRSFNHQEKQAGKKERSESGSISQRHDYADLDT